MLTQELDVIFKYDSDSKTKTILCDSVLFGLELIGQVDDLLDYTLDEDYKGVRQLIDISVKLDLSETQWIFYYLKAEDKKLVIDNTTYEVVCSGKNYKFPIFKKINLFSYPKLRFKAKNTGIQNPGVYPGGLNQLGQLHGVEL